MTATTQKTQQAIQDGEAERHRRWCLALGTDDTQGLCQDDRRLDRALTALYGRNVDKGRRKGGLGSSSPQIARWLGDIRSFFPAPVVQIIQRDALERHNLKAMLLEPELLESLEGDVHLVADLIALKDIMPARTVETARLVVSKVVDALMARLATKTQNAIRGAINRLQRTARPRPADIDWPRTIKANLQHWQPDYQTVVPHKLVGHARRRQTRADLDRVIMCVDQSGSMANSVVYASIFSAVMASLPVLDMRLICFDTSIIDLSDQLEDPVSVLFGIQLGGGTDIDTALAYGASLIEQPAKTHFILISDLYEGGDAGQMLARAAEMIESGVNLIVLLALSDDGRPACDTDHAKAFAAMGCAVFACTPDHFPDMMAAALKREDLHVWAGARDIPLFAGG
ncbi:VWA domain-containing protein [Asaia lannensis]|uniref:VWA domain-containing protein n=1 Tax=Asaia lannensis NBRC 102526 TaxID=1307926 RepID=A0ABT1CC23_9PROT|nr:VWA domain-containing protein [Asaia lannensis]MCO6158430.1 VWA domain-containing protein [Asaia lannensis NBRC 102526]GBR01267.1 hypothetical protein AA102526_2459 [Asaia lannensis NBRC 102526]